ncbi:MAG: hypothetical protein K2K83_05625 [Rikenella sp.]|nr:hypothetical protein [Rikenella sp.]
MGVLQTPALTRGRGLTALSAGTVFAPAPGHRYPSYGTLWGVGYNGFSFSSSPAPGNYVYYLDIDPRRPLPNSHYHRAIGLSLRCLQE